MDRPASGELGLAMAQPASVSDAPGSRDEQRALCRPRAGFGAAAGEGVKNGGGLLCGIEACRGDGDWLGKSYGSGEEGEEESSLWTGHRQESFPLTSEQLLGEKRVNSSGCIGSYSLSCSGTN